MPTTDTQQPQTSPMTFSEEFLQRYAAHVALLEWENGAVETVGPFRDHAEATAFVNQAQRDHNPTRAQALPLGRVGVGPVPGAVLADALDRWLEG